MPSLGAANEVSLGRIEQRTRPESVAHVLRNAILDGTLRLYEQIRAGNRGVGAARLVGMNCQACHLALPATEVDRIRHLPAEALARCEHCGAILVR